MSGTGKTTLSSIVKTELEKRKFSVEIVYGDKAREKYEIPLGFDRKDIEKYNKKLPESQLLKVNSFDREFRAYKPNTYNGNATQLL